LGVKKILSNQLRFGNPKNVYGIEVDLTSEYLHDYFPVTGKKSIKKKSEKNFHRLL